MRTSNGGVAQLGEHLLCKQGVVSSSLIISTRAPDRNLKGMKEGVEEMGP